MACYAANLSAIGAIEKLYKPSLARIHKGRWVVVSVTLSGDFVDHVRWLYWHALDQVKEGGVVREGCNVFTQHAAPAYICAVAAVEAFINETVFGTATFAKPAQSPLAMLDQDWVEKLELKHKLVIIPQLLFSCTFDRGGQPYQDMSILIRIRNDLVHYRMVGQTPGYIAHLQERRIVLATGKPSADYAWVHKLSCSEGIRWANNTTCRLVHAFAEMVPEGEAVPLLQTLANNFSEISDDLVGNRFKELEPSE